MVQLKDQLLLSTVQVLTLMASQKKTYKDPLHMAGLFPSSGVESGCSMVVEVDLVLAVPGVTVAVEEAPSAGGVAALADWVLAIENCLDVLLMPGGSRKGGSPSWVSVSIAATPGSLVFLIFGRTEGVLVTLGDSAALLLLLSAVGVETMAAYDCPCLDGVFGVEFPFWLSLSVSWGR